MKPVQPKLLPLVRPYFNIVSRARLQVDAGTGEFAMLSADQLLDRLDVELERVRTEKNQAPELAALLRDGDPLFDDLRAFGSSVLASGPSDRSKEIGVSRRRRGPRGPIQDSDFVEHLRAEMQSITPATVERLVIYSVCLGLGYKGAFDESNHRRIRSELWGHIQKLVPAPRTSHERSPYVKPLFGEAYDIRTEQLSQPPVRWTPVYVACAVALVAIVVAVMSVMSAGDKVSSALADIEQAPVSQAEAGVGPEKPAPANDAEPPALPPPAAGR